jgi:hypothetical protein
MHLLGSPSVRGSPFCGGFGIENILYRAAALRLSRLQRLGCSIGEEGFRDFGTDARNHRNGGTRQLAADFLASLHTKGGRCRIVAFRMYTERVMASVLTGVEPQEIWKHFEMLAAIPRASTNEAAAREHVLKLAKAHGLETLVD